MRLKILFILPLVLLLLDYCLSNTEELQVKTRYGTYIGHLMKSRNGRDIQAFKGIPYAQPPTGTLRFKKPVQLKESEDILDANKEKVCLQPEMTTEGVELINQYIGSEDCLYLNIYVPDSKSKDLLPVYVWIHGGGFAGGAGVGNGFMAWNGPEYFLDENRDMILVTMNYRLGLLGFLSANDVNLPGNLGLKDQSMALKWVKENIEEFRGDPESITIGGVDAGAASVSHHLNSKASKGLFHRAISHSGTADCPWAMKSSKEARQVASNIISFLGCPFEPNELLECLQDLPVDILLNSMNTLKVANTSMIAYLVPVVEKDSPTAFMTEESIAKGSNIPWLTGITNEEGLFFYQILGILDSGLNLSMTKEKYKELLPVIAYYDCSCHSENITEELIKYYFQGEDFSEKTEKNFVQLISDRLFNHGLHISSKKYKGKMYMYLLSYKGENSISVLRPKGLEDSVGHFDDLLYFFESNFTRSNHLSEKDSDISNTLLNMWYNFIKKSDPTPDTNVWGESEGGNKYMDFTNGGLTFTMRTDLFKERMAFLDSLDYSSQCNDVL